MRPTKWLLVICVVLIPKLGQTQSVPITGTVRDAETRIALAFCNVTVPGTSIGVTTDNNGKFDIAVDRNKFNRLVFSFVGYVSDTLSLIPGKTNYAVSLKPDLNSLQEVVVVSGTMKEVSKMDSPIPVEIYTPALFAKNPTPGIFESLGMINGVQPQLNCNVCNTGDIHINGMEGPYTMILIDGMPIVSSLATVYGLSGIPTSMVKRIEVVKGPASTLYGSEAVGGLINIITKDAGTAPQFKADVSSTSLQEHNVDVSTKWRTGKSSALLGINYFNFGNKVDINDDNFTDVTQQQRISVFNKWDFERTDNRLASLGFRYVYEDRWGGEMQWNRKHRGSDRVYGESIYTNRFELIGNYQLPVNGKKIIFDYSYNYHLQDSYYGATPYLADQHVAFMQLRWDVKIGLHDLLVGIPFRYVFYDDNTVGTARADHSNRPMQTYLPGIFIQDEMKLNERITLLSGLRYDRHSIHGNILSPRVSMKYSPDKQNTFRLSTGNGFRVVNLFTEDHAALTGAREVIIEEELKPEQSWNVNLNYATTHAHNSGYVGFDASLFYTYFTNKIVGDFTTDPDKIIYNNLNGHAVSKGVTLNTELMFTNSLKIMGGVTLMDVYQVESEIRSDKKIKQQQLFAPHVTGTYSVSYTLDRHGISFDITGRLNGPMKLPVGDRTIDDRPDKSPWFTIINFQVTKTFLNGFEFYGGVKNILNFMPDDPLLGWENPFGKNFDTSYNYASVQGIKGFAGLRYTIQ